MATNSSVLAWENSMDRGAWWATVHGSHKELDMTKQHTHTRTRTCMHTHCPKYFFKHLHFTTEETEEQRERLGNWLVGGEIR